jgi:hypothetical protein
MPKGASIGLTSDGFWQTGIGFDSLCVAQVAEPAAEDIARGPVAVNESDRGQQAPWAGLRGMRQHLRIHHA